MIYLQDPDFTLRLGDVREELRELPDESVHCVVTSPPYWGLRDYGTGTWEGGDAECDHAQAVQHPDGPLVAASCKCGAIKRDRQLGLEPTPEEYVANMVEVFREVRRVLREDGTCWLNIGDSYASVPGGQQQGANGQMADRSVVKARAQVKDTNATRALPAAAQTRPPGVPGLKPKDLCMVPARLALALQADGWYLRSEITWCKPNPMPESVTDRPTQATEKVYLLTKSPRYFFDQEAVREPAEWARWGAQNGAGKYGGENSKATMVQSRTKQELQKKAEGSGRNLRNWWPIATEPYPDAHFATFPTELVRRCIFAGCPLGGTVLDPFVGSGTTALVARKHGRNCIGIELSGSYCELAARRLQQLSLLSEGAA